LTTVTHPGHFKIPDLLRGVKIGNPQGPWPSQ
jgi:hypothetical protein